MRVLIDGHNALGALDVPGRTHEERRHALLERVGGLVADATVFFDARRAPEGLFEREAMFGVLAVYCRDEHADEYIQSAKAILDGMPMSIRESLDPVADYVLHRRR